MRRPYSDNTILPSSMCSFSASSANSGEAENQKKATENKAGKELTMNLNCIFEILEMRTEWTSHKIKNVFLLFPMGQVNAVQI